MKTKFNQPRSLFNLKISTVEINEINYYGINGAGKAVFKISADVTCNLREAGSNVVFPFQCSTVFGIEID